MKIRGLRTFWRTAQWIRNRFTQGALILLYHRVAELPSDPQLLSVTPEHFAEHLEILRKQSQPMGLRQLAQARQDGDVPERAVVVTFDDGYFDNLLHAKPLLERYEIPATVFITTGFIGSELEFWWDALERLLLRPGTLPEKLVLRRNGRVHHWELGREATYEEDAFLRNRAWNVLKKDVPGLRQRLYRSLHQMIRTLSADEQQKVMDVVVAWAGGKTSGRSTHRTMSADEIVCLGEGGLVEVGAHSVTHPVLSALPPEMQKAEIRNSRTQLEEILGRQVTSFAYPYGYRSDYTARTISTVREAGFGSACSAIPGLVWRGSDMFQLPRLPIFDWDGEAFARRIQRWFGRA
jgi:peptidoglycan/xylan/chitin deacetylase (PgdA/CDA1 family)